MVPWEFGILYFQVLSVSTIIYLEGRFAKYSILISFKFCMFVTQLKVKVSLFL